MKTITKRDGRTQRYNKFKFIESVISALKSSGVDHDEAYDFAVDLEDKFSNTDFDTTIEIGDYIEKKLMGSRYKNAAKLYIYKRKERMEKRGNIIDKTILGILDGTDEYWTDENSNKNAALISTQRDYMAGTVSTDLSRRLFLPKKVCKAHDEGAIHVHDMDYFAMHLFNCCLVDVNDMLQNGTVINKVKIDKPHSIGTAATIMSQIAGVIASGQLGGQTMSIAALAPFVDMDRQRIRKEIIEETYDMYDSDLMPNPNDIEKRAAIITEKRVDREIEKAIQTLSYQINTINSTNGQTPFISLALNINEAEEGQTRDDLAKIIAEIFKQRIQGFKNEQGIWVTPSFPKLLYFLDDNNTYAGSEYFWLTKRAAECTAKRMVPDYISAKKMRELKNGDVFPCINKPVHVKSI